MRLSAPPAADANAHMCERRISIADRAAAPSGERYIGPEVLMFVPRSVLFFLAGAVAAVALTRLLPAANAETPAFTPGCAWSKVSLTPAALERVTLDVLQAQRTAGVSGSSVSVNAGSTATFVCSW